MIGKSALFMPSSSPSMLNAACACNADSLIFDLEDSVAADEKDAARDLLKEALNHLYIIGKNIIVRINALSTDYWKKDIEAVVDTKINTILIPKARPDDIKNISDLLNSHNTNINLMALIESAVSVEEITDIIKASKRVIDILFGAEDYTSDLGIERSQEGSEIFYARARLANAAHAYGIEALDTPFTILDDFEGLKEDTLKGKKLGYTGKASINPRHIDLINKIYTPSEKEVEYALRVINSVERAQKKAKVPIH